jgi:hypothetical protein
MSGRRARALLQALEMAPPIGAGLGFGGNALGFSREEMPAKVARLYRDRRATDAMHAPTIEAALARLDAAGITYIRPS